MNCPSCGAPHTGGGERIAFCKCGHRWLAVSEETHRKNERTNYGHSYAGYVPDPAFLAFAKSFTRDELLTRRPPPGRLLDVGCGAGDFLAVAVAAGYEAEGIDVSEAAAEICREKGLKARSGDLLEEDFDDRFDVITLWDVVEHLRDPIAVLRRAGELLRPGGLLFAKVPAFGDLSVRLSATFPRFAGLLLGAPSHVQYFTKSTLKTAVERAGMDPDCTEGRGIRSQKAGGRLKTRLARAARGPIRILSGDCNLFLFAEGSEERAANPPTSPVS